MFEDGRPQPIAVFHHGDAPITPGKIEVKVIAAGGPGRVHVRTRAGYIKDTP